LFPDTLNLRDIWGFRDCVSEDSRLRDYDTMSFGKFWWNFLVPSLQYVYVVLLLDFEDPIVVGNKLVRKYLIFYQSRRRHISENFNLYAQYLFSSTKRSEYTPVSLSDSNRYIFKLLVCVLLTFTLPGE
jgi:hypothetical protein